MASAPSEQILLGLALKEVRQARGLTQEQLWRETGVRPTYISDIERGARNPSWIVLVRLARGLSVRSPRSRARMTGWQGRGPD